MTKVVFIILNIETCYYKRLWAIEASKHQQLDGFRTKKTFVFNGKPEHIPVWCEQFLAYIEDKNLSEDSKKLAKPTGMLPCR